MVGGTRPRLGSSHTHPSGIGITGGSKASEGRLHTGVLPETNAKVLASARLTIDLAETAAPVFAGAIGLLACFSAAIRREIL